MCSFHVTIARKVLGNAHIDYRTNTFQKGALLSWELCWTLSLTKIELSIWDNLYRPSVLPWSIIRCPNPFLCAKQTTHWKTLLYGRQKKQKNLSDHKLDHHWWLGHPANSLFVGCSNRFCWWWDKVMDLDVAHHQGTPGHNRAHQGIQGTPGQGSHYFDCPSSRVRRGQLPCWAVNSEGPPWLDCPSN